MDKWEGLKNQLEKIGRSEKVFVGHILMVMDELKNNPNWDLKRDNFVIHGSKENR